MSLEGRDHSLTARNSSHSRGDPSVLLRFAVPETAVRCPAVARTSEGSRGEGQLVGSQVEFDLGRRPAATAALPTPKVAFDGPLGGDGYRTEYAKTMALCKWVCASSRTLCPVRLLKNR